jgi:spore coat protein CotH
MLLVLAGCVHPSVSDEAVETIPSLDGEFLWAETGILSFSVELDDAALASLASRPDEDVHATFGFEDERYDVGLHLKGSAGSFQTMQQKPAFRIDFHQWHRGATFHGVRRLTLNNMVQDASMLAEQTAYHLFALRGVPASRHGYARLAIDGKDYGLYGLVETPDEQLLDRLFPGEDEGNLYEGGYGADVQPDREGSFDVKEGGGDTADLTELIAAVQGADDTTFPDVLDAWFDVDTLLRMWAVELAIGDVDGYVTLANNYLLYHPDGGQRWEMLPWGPDLAFSKDSDVHAEYVGELAVRCLAAPACASRLDDAIATTFDDWEQGDLAGYVADQAARIEDACRTDPKSPYGEACDEAITKLEDYIAKRPGSVRSQIR